MTTRYLDPKNELAFKKKHTPSLFDMVDMEEELSTIVGRRVDLKTAEDLSH